MNDGPQDQKSDGYDTADEPTTGPPAGAVSASALDAGSHPGPGTASSGAESRDPLGTTRDSGPGGLFRSRRSADPGTGSAVAGAGTGAGSSTGAGPGATPARPGVG